LSSVLVYGCILLTYK